MDKRDFIETERFLKQAATSLQKVAGELGRSDEVAQARVKAAEALRSLGAAARMAAKAAGDSLREAAEATKRHDAPTSGSPAGDKATPSPPATGS